MKGVGEYDIHQYSFSQDVLHRQGVVIKRITMGNLACAEKGRVAAVSMKWCLVDIILDLGLPLCATVAELPLSYAQTGRPTRAVCCRNYLAC